MKSLIVGCGRKQVKSFQNRCVAIDIAKEFIKDSRRIRPDNEYVQADANLLPFKENSFNHVTCTEVIEHVKTPKELLKEINRVLIQNGEAILSVPFADKCRYIAQIFPAYKRDFYEGYHPSEFTYESFIELLEESNLRITKIEKTGKTSWYFWKIWGNLSRALNLDLSIEETGKIKLNTKSKIKNSIFKLTSKAIRVIAIPLGYLFPVYTGIKVRTKKVSSS